MFDIGIIQGTDAEHEDFSRGIFSLVDQLKKVEEEYYMLPEDEEEIGVSELFDYRAWVSVGSGWRSEEIGEAILTQVDPKAHKMVMGGDMEKIGEGLKESLKGKLIVLDDVSNYKIDEYFPENKNGSHILLSTRMKYVGIDASATGYPFELWLLDKEESWDLLREKVFAGSSCPPNLEKDGKKIAEKCDDGLPLTILTVADLLSKAEESIWIKVAAQRKHQLFMDAYDQISKMLVRLDALNIRFYDFPIEVLELVKLRYLALTCNGILPPSISDLQNLQYLIVHPHLSIKSCGALYNLPMEIWDMKSLKHLQIMGYGLPDLGGISLQKLITLSGVTIDSCAVLNRVPNLQKLGIIIELASDAAEPLCYFDHISYLTKLESLKCVIVILKGSLRLFSLLLHFSLTKLNLNGLGDRA
ncbi:hypothetical protein ACS0TY_007142 [Phlomoides rotata]